MSFQIASVVSTQLNLSTWPLWILVGGGFMETPTDSATGPIIKSDRTGRTRYTAQYKREVLDAFEASSLSAPAFAMQCGVKYPTFE